MLGCEVLRAELRRLMPRASPGWPFSGGVADAFMVEGAACPERDALTVSRA